MHVRHAMHIVRGAFMRGMFKLELGDAAAHVVCKRYIFSRATNAALLDGMDSVLPSYFYNSTIDGEYSQTLIHILVWGRSLDHSVVVHV